MQANHNCADQEGQLRTEPTEEQKLLTQLVYVLLATEPLWKRLPDPGPLMGEEFLCAVLEAGFAGAD